MGISLYWVFGLPSPPPCFNFVPPPPFQFTATKMKGGRGVQNERRWGYKNEGGGYTNKGTGGGTVGYWCALKVMSLLLITVNYWAKCTPFKL